MNQPVSQQIVISGVGGQGVLFITRVLAEAAIRKDLKVFTSETHGMAQRGGTVLSHLKVGEFDSPLIRMGQADGLMALKPENVKQHSCFLKAKAWTVVNRTAGESAENLFSVDADLMAEKSGNPKSANLILLGFALKKIPNLFCTFEDVRDVLAEKFRGNEKMLEIMQLSENRD
ncbi:MAG: 2-oxoacid:acceptor oxidoreductase family protein [Desulfococcaceae bacterium]